MVALVDMEWFSFQNGDALVHRPKECAGDPCCLHNPSDHKMVDCPLVLRETSLIERLCPHGVGHPDPDSVAYLDEHGPPGARGSWGVHGCCHEECCHSTLTP